MTPRSVRRAAAAAVLVACLLASACSSGTPTAEVPLDPTATLDVNPVAYEGVGVVTATFASATAGRMVSLQRMADRGWTEVATGKEDQNGRVEFQLKDTKGSFRAVAAEAGANQPAVTTLTASADDLWRQELDAGFGGDQLNTKYWHSRMEGSYEARGRHCSASYATNVDVEGDRVALSVTEETMESRIARAKGAGCGSGLYFRSAMISTETTFTMPTGLVAAKVRLATGQGPQGGVWLQSVDGAKIDLIASHGYGDGIASLLTVDGKQYPTAQEAYVNVQAVKNEDWWAKDHVYSVEWDTRHVVFRIDGVVTQTVEKRIKDTEYFIVLGLLTTDAAQKRFSEPLDGATGVTRAELPQTMSVDWVRAWTRV
jgi:beta-glucanase (GH16 family)